MLLVQDDRPFGGDTATEGSLAGILLDHIPLENQSQDLLNDLLDGDRQLHRDTDLRLVLPDAAGGHVFDDLQVLQVGLAQSSSSGLAIFRKASWQ